MQKNSDKTIQLIPKKTIFAAKSNSLSLLTLKNKKIMKKILMTLVMGMMALTMNAQMYIGGSVGFQSWSPDKGDGETSFKLLPEIGMQFNDQWGAGVQIGYVSDKANVYGVASESAFVFAPYARYTALKSGKISLFLDGGFDYYSYSKPDNSEFTIGIKPGVAVALSDKLSLVTRLGFLGYESIPAVDYTGSGDKPKDTYFGFDFNSLNILFGLYYNF